MTKPILLVSLLSFCSLYKGTAQDIEPRRWAPVPMGSHIIGLGYVYQSGDIYFDPVLQAENVTMDVHAVAGVYIQPFKLGTKLGRIDVQVPYVSARWDGLLSGEPTVKKRYGFSDPRIRVSMNLIGPNAMNAKDMLEYYKSHPVNTMVGVSFAVTFPLGLYDEDRLLNVGQNRFVFRPQVGMVHNWGLWSYEFTSSVFLFSNNNHFYNKQVRKQKPVIAVQSHLIKRFTNNMWVSLSGAYGVGGEAIVEGNELGDQHSDLLYSASFGMPLSRTQAVKIVYLHTETLRDVGADTDSVGLSWTKLF